LKIYTRKEKSFYKNNVKFKFKNKNFCKGTQELIKIECRKKCKRTIQQILNFWFQNEEDFTPIEASSPISSDGPFLPFTSAPPAAPACRGLR
jgi:hypothetical protein